MNVLQTSRCVPAVADRGGPGEAEHGGQATCLTWTSHEAWPDNSASLTAPFSPSFITAFPSFITALLPSQSPVDDDVEPRHPKE